MRIATWNIRAGGGRRTEPIARVILDERPDILVLTEYRPAPGKALLELLAPLAYQVAAGLPTGIQNSVCVLSRLALEPITVGKAPSSLHRWVTVAIPALNLVVLGVHVPNQTEIWNKREFLDRIEAFATEMDGKRSIIIGDLNTALDEDCEGEKIREAVYLQRLFAAGWADAWRIHNPDAHEFTWYSHRANGFRLDQCLVSPALSKSIVGASYIHDVRSNRLSDHSYLYVELDTGRHPQPSAR